MTPPASNRLATTGDQDRGGPNAPRVPRAVTYRVLYRQLEWSRYREGQLRNHVKRLQAALRRSERREARLAEQAARLAITPLQRTSP